LATLRLRAPDLPDLVGFHERSSTHRPGSGTRFTGAAAPPTPQKKGAHTEPAGGQPRSGGACALMRRRPQRFRVARAASQADLLRVGQGAAVHGGARAADRGVSPSFSARVTTARTRS
jgi:hypothetical protein